jgi:hypothetical protein
MHTVLQTLISGCDALISFLDAFHSNPFWFMALAVYLAPTFVAFGRGHKQRLAITLLNTLGGWTVLGWIAALVWSVVI